jgi:predicted metal-dependent phosphotriesterase family hydrolase
MTAIIMTVTGPVAPEQLGLALPHEHIMSTCGADPARYPEYALERLLGQVLPYLARLKALGLSAVADCTAAFFGRHPELLRRISRESGLLLLTNTGYYAARQNRYVPPHAFGESAEQIAARWVREWRDGIDETGIRPGFIKIAVEETPLSEMEIKLVRAAILTHLQTGLVIQTHTGDNPPAAGAILDWLEQEGARPSAWMWVHASSVADTAHLLAAARRGAWISLDGVSAERSEHILSQLRALRDAGFLGQVLLSHDGDLFTVDGGLRPCEYLLTDFIPRLGQQGFSSAEIQQLTVTNPARAFAVDSLPQAGGIRDQEGLRRKASAAAGKLGSPGD